MQLVSHRFTAPAQHALVRHLVLGEPGRVDDLTRTFYGKKHLGRSVRSLELRIGPSDIPGDLHATSAGRRALELSLIGLLPFIGQNVRDVSVAASYDCPGRCARDACQARPTPTLRTACSAFLPSSSRMFVPSRLPLPLAVRRSLDHLERRGRT